MNYETLFLIRPQGEELGFCEAKSEPEDKLGRRWKRPSGVKKRVS